MLSVLLSAVMRSRGIGESTGIPEAEEVEHRLCWSNCLEHAFSQTGFCGLGEAGRGVGPWCAGTGWGVLGQAPVVGSFLARSLTPSNLLLHLCLHLYNSKTLFVAPAELEFHTLSLSLFMLFALNLP